MGLGVRCDHKYQPYVAPANAAQVLRINTVLGTVEVMGQESDATTSTRFYGVVAPNNCNYLALYLNTDVATVEMIGPDISCRYAYEALGVLASNNCVYYAPYDAGQVICINTGPIMSAVDK